MNSASVATLPPCRVLFVDDEPAVLLAIERVLRRAGETWECEFFTDPVAALERMRAIPFNVVVSDMHMPGMNGAEFLSRVREQSPDTVRVMLTGCADLETAMSAVNEGRVFHFLLKPCENDKLRQSIAAAARQHQLQSAERTLLLTQIEHAQKMTDVGRLAAGITHDLNNILTVIMAESEMAILDGETGEASNPAFGRIREAAMRAAELTRELNEFNRCDQTVDLGPLDLRSVVESCVRIVRPMIEKRVDLLVEPWPDLPVIHGHPNRLKQVIMNLVINARDAMPEGGHVRFQARKCQFQESDVIAHPGRRPGRHVCLAVSDTGCGMDLATQQRMFEPFFTTKAVGKGTGLGLFMVHSILGQHQGWVEVESAVGHGTTFNIFLPEAPAAGDERKAA